MDRYYAKSDGKTTVKQHCKAVAELARQYGKDIGLTNDAYYAGLFHDAAKYGQDFQDVLKNLKTGRDHACPSACLFSSLTNHKPMYISEAIAAHHSRLIPFEELAGTFRDMLTHDQTTCPSGKQSVLNSRKEFQETALTLKSDWPNLKITGLENIDCDFTSWKSELQYMLSVRMLLSCLVDADYTVSSAEATGNTWTKPENCLSPEPALTALSKYRACIIQNQSCSKTMQSMREAVYKDCDSAGRDTKHNFYTLTAPTGSGKTLGILKFALEQCKHDPTKKRIIIVLPFLSISDQIAEIVQEIIPNTIIDNSQVDLNEEQREIASRWDAPCVITTTVQFFGSLFSDRPGDCRKLHRIANSVVLFDEVQALPVSLSAILMQALHELTSKYATRICLSTATQPAYAKIPGLDFKAHEIIKNTRTCFSLTNRAKIEFNSNLRSLDDIASVTSKHRNVCVIVNLKSHTRQIYNYWQKLGLTNCFMLSTDLCGSHRQDILKQVKTLQSQSDDIHVIATQCIEAGVDIDFEQVFRALASLPSLIQAIGRMNRHGLRATGRMTVFEPNCASRYPDTDYEHQTILVKLLLSDNVNLNSPNGIDMYYSRLFKNFENPEPVTTSLNALDYTAFAKHTRLIQQSGYRVIVPYDGHIDTYQEILNNVLSNNAKKSDLRKSAAISVTTYDRQGIENHCQELVITNRKTGAETHTGTYILLPGHEACYDKHTGLNFNNADSMHVL